MDEVDQSEKNDGSEPYASAAAAAVSKVFISYASQDAAVAEKICAALEAARLPCWIAPRDVRAGQSYAAAIVEAINSCRMLVLLLSQGAIDSPHVLREVERASSKRRAVLSVRMDATKLPADLEYFLSANQWLDASGRPIEEILPALIECVRGHEGGMGGQAPGSSNTAARSAPGPVSSPAQSKPSSHWKTRAIALALAVAAVGLAYVLTNKLWLSKRVTSEQAKTATPNVVSDKSIAVLPFLDLSEKKDQEYFATGIAEEVLDRLAKVPGLHVVGRTSSFQFKGKNIDAASIGAALGVAYLLEGSVRREAGRVRVAAQLIEARTGSERWSDRFDSEVVDVLRIQDTLAAELARALQIAVQVGTEPRSSTIKSPEALDAYLRGLQSLDRSTLESSEAAVAQFQQALSLDSKFAPAANGLAKTHALIGEVGWLPPRVAFERAREAALRAQRLDPKSPVPHEVMARIHAQYDFDWDGAGRELQQAFALGPRDSYGVTIAATLAGALGHWDEGRQLGIEAIALDPLSSDALITLGYCVYLNSGDFAAAEQAFRRALQITPGYDVIDYFLGEALMLQGRLEPALAEFQKATPDDGQAVGSAMAYFAAGRKAESDAQLAEAIRQNHSDWPEGIASVYAFRGEKDHAFEWLDRAYEARDHLYIIKGDPLMKKLRGDPRFKAFLRKMNLPE
jgi:adenylate cyclase